jgi:hypothetical protein
MCLETRKFYVVRVNDLKPLRGHEIAEAYDAGELVYICRADRKDVPLVDMGVGGRPQLIHSSCTGC